MQTLRTAKLALEEGLIEQSDFDVVKTAFLKAQQVKAGMDAGFLREEDYQQARTSFLQTLGFEVDQHGQHQHGHQQQHAAPHYAAPAPMAPPAARVQHQAAAPVAPHVAPIATQNGSTRSKAPEAHAAARGPASPQHPPRQQQQQPQSHMPPAPPAVVAIRAVHQSNNSSATGSPHAGHSSIADLSELPRLVKPGIAAGKKSMSGITVNEVCINVFNHMKTKSTFKWVTYKIDDGGKDVVPEAVGPSGSNYGEFIAALPELQCRYGVFDYAYVNNDTAQTLNKLVFVNWAPDTASTRTKMMYASTKDFFKGFLDGVGAELQASDMSELEETEMKDRIHQALTRK